ncbi:MAG: TlpA disulfide reductase family protein [Acidimicrobiales bacterium]|nr:TlpA family protein disulfide reductase [Acidimicrobiales bacterium]
MTTAPASPAATGGATGRRPKARRVRTAALLATVAAALVALLVGCGSDSGASGDGTTTAATADGSLPKFDATVADDPAVGTTIPTVTGDTFDGDSVTIEADGKAKLLMFVAHWCPHCQREVPLLKAYLDDNPMPDDVELITISTNVAANAVNYPPQEWLEREGWQATTIQDDDKSSIAAKFGLTSFPYFVAVDADGKVVQRTSGEISTDEFEALIAAAQG